ncbi:MAG: hypothetical protein ACI9VN_003612, partial [Patescibacteria group bacterium]
MSKIKFTAVLFVSLLLAVACGKDEEQTKDPV